MSISTFAGGAALLEKTYTLAEVATAFRVSREKARLIFRNEPGVIRLDAGPSEPAKRRRHTYRVPEGVFLRVRARMTNSGAI